MNPRDFTRISALLIILTLFLLILAPFSITLASAAVTDLNVNPQIVEPGDTISITGKASSANEEVWLSSSFELSLPVAADGRYSREFSGIHFPEGEKKFSVRAEHVKNIRVSVSPVFWQTIEYPLEGPRNATNGIATLSISFPLSTSFGTFDIKGKKDIKVYGGAVDGATSVSLKTGTAIKLTADSNGVFSLDLNTEGIPEGEFLIAAGEIEKSAYIGRTPTPSPTLSPTPALIPSYSPSPSPTTPPSSKIKQPWGLVIGVIIIAVLITTTAYYFYRRRKE